MSGFTFGGEFHSHAARAAGHQVTQVIQCQHPLVQVHLVVSFPDVGTQWNQIGQSEEGDAGGKQGDRDNGQQSDEERGPDNDVPDGMGQAQQLAIPIDPVGRFDPQEIDRQNR